MAKTKNDKKSEVTLEDIILIFETIGGTISEDDDNKVSHAIKELSCSNEEKVELLVKYARNLERDIHYLRR